MDEAQQTMAVHRSHLSSEMVAYLGAEGFGINLEPGWLFFAGRPNPDAGPMVRAVHPGDMTPPMLRQLADEGLSLVSDPHLLCFTRPAPVTAPLTIVPTEG